MARSKMRGILSSHRAWYALALLMCVVPLAAAEFLQSYLDIGPCALCVIQRYAFVWLGLWALFGVLLGRLPKWTDALAIIGGLGGAGVAVYQLWVLAHPKTECVKDEVEQWINDLPTAQWFPSMFTASGNCNAKLPLIFGLQFPTWALIGLGGISILWLIFLLKRRR